MGPEMGLEMTDRAGGGSCSCGGDGRAASGDAVEDVGVNIGVDDGEDIEAGRIYSFFRVLCRWMCIELEVYTYSSGLWMRGYVYAWMYILISQIVLVRCR
jgi:hypothetical protein